MADDINALKRKVFYDMLEMAGRVFVLVAHADDVVIGNRGFLPEEKEKGIVLVFNSRMNFEWGERALTARLVFGSNTEKCYIPHDRILSVFSPELSAQFSVSPPAVPKLREVGRKVEVQPEEPPAKEGKVVKVDFNKKRP